MRGLLGTPLAAGWCWRWSLRRKNAGLAVTCCNLDAEFVRNSSALRPEGLDDAFVGREVRSLQEVDAIGDRRKHRQQTLADGGRLARQVDDQRLPAGAGKLP